MTLVNNFMAGFLGVFGIETVRAVANVLVSYVSPSGSTLEDMIDTRVGGGN